MATRFIVLATFLVLANCAGTIKTVSDGCVWVKKIAPDPLFETRWTRGEKEQVVAHNLKVDKACR